MVNRNDHRCLSQAAYRKLAVQRMAQGGAAVAGVGSCSFGCDGMQQRAGKLGEAHGNDACVI